MNRPSQEDLLGYVLGALDAQEHEQLQKQIDQDPQLEDQLLDIKHSLVPLDLIDEPAGPPVGLARRTCEFVANLTHFEQPIPAETPSADLVPDHSAAPVMSEKLEQPTRSRGWSRTDFLALAGAIAVLAGILLPAVSYTRHASRVTACQNNLQSLGTAFFQYSDLYDDGRFVEIPDDENLGFSGIYAVVLKDRGLIEESLILCAGSSSNRSIAIPTLAQLETAVGEQLQNYKMTAGGDYGYSLGYAKNNRYEAPRNLGRPHAVLLADAPSCTQNNRRSANHGGYGQNCLFEDGHVAFVRGHMVAEDPIFENDMGFVGPGLHNRDNVIAASHLPPIIMEIQRLQTPVGQVD